MRMRVHVDDLPRMESINTSSTAKSPATSACFCFHLSSPASAAALSGEFATTINGIFSRAWNQSTHRRQPKVRQLQRVSVSIFPVLPAQPPCQENSPPRSMASSLAASLPLILRAKALPAEPLLPSCESAEAKEHPQGRQLHLCRPAQAISRVNQGMNQSPSADCQSWRSVRQP